MPHLAAAASSHSLQRVFCMKSQGEIEAAVSDGISKFHQDFIGRGPKDIRAHLIDTLLVVRLCGALSAAERQLMQPSGDGPMTAANHDGHPHDGDAHGNGRSLLKQVRGHMVAIGRSRLATIVQEATGVPLVSVHHDISTVTGEEVIVFSLGAMPHCRPKRLPRRGSD
jgi:uncharacterized protein YbcI